MKYWPELNKIENELIRLDTLFSLVNVMSNGAESSRSETVVNCLYLLEEQIDDIRKKAYEAYDNLFSLMREDTEDDYWEDDYEEFTSPLETNEFRQTPESVKELDSVVRTWPSL